MSVTTNHTFLINPPKAASVSGLASNLFPQFITKDFSPKEGLFIKSQQ